jgi:Sulfotransferase domain
MVYESDLQRLDVPGRAEFPRYDVDIVSAEFPCGVAWLATALLALGVSLWQPWGILDANMWRKQSRSRWRYEFPGSGWRRLVPGFVDGATFALRQSPVPRFGHHWPNMLAPSAKRILWVRDPRDALFSAWRRGTRVGLIEQTVDFSQWTQMPFAHLSVSNADYLQWFWRAWLVDADASPLLIVRFEDSKRDPRGTLHRVLQFLGMRVGGRACARASYLARHEHAKHADQTLAQAGVGKALLAGGIAQEWRTHFTAAMHDAVGQGFDTLASQLGYCGFQSDSPLQRNAVVDPHLLACEIFRGHEGAPAPERIAALSKTLQAATLLATCVSPTA